MERIIPRLIESLEEEYGKPREGIHVSDITLCPRKSAFQKIDPVPLDARSLNFFSSGRAIHESLQILAKRYPDRYEIEKEVKYGDIIGHVDLFDKVLQRPIEAKSMRMKEIFEPKPHHIPQLKAYMALTNSNDGILLYQLLLHFDEAPWREYHINMDHVQIHDTLEWLKIDAAELKNAIANNNAGLARHIAYNPDLNWLCKSCPYLDPCTAMRVKERMRNE